jgi:hypothetical protein
MRGRPKTKASPCVRRRCPPPSRPAHPECMPRSTPRERIRPQRRPPPKRSQPLPSRGCCARRRRRAASSRFGTFPRGLARPRTPHSPPPRQPLAAAALSQGSPAARRRRSPCAACVRILRPAPPRGSGLPCGQSRGVARRRGWGAGTIRGRGRGAAGLHALAKWWWWRRGERACV